MIGLVFQTKMGRLTDKYMLLYVTIFAWFSLNKFSKHLNFGLPYVYKFLV